MLILHRREGQAVFAGFDLDPENIDNTFDHIFTVTDIENSPWTKRADIAVAFSDGTVKEISLRPGAGGVRISDGVILRMLSIKEFRNSRGEEEKLVRIGFDAPRNYKIVRDNAVYSYDKAA